MTKNTSHIQENKEKTNSQKGIKPKLKGLLCLIFGHDWASYNEHCYICTCCMAVAPKG